VADEEVRCSLAVRRHLGFFEYHVTSKHGIVLLQFELTLLLLLVLGRVVSETRSFTRDQSDIVTHSGAAGITVLLGAQLVLWSSGFLEEDHSTFGAAPCWGAASLQGRISLPYVAPSLLREDLELHTPILGTTFLGIVLRQGLLQPETGRF
jgi:hypothetical protein